MDQKVEFDVNILIDGIPKSKISEECVADMRVLDDDSLNHTQDGLPECFIELPSKAEEKKSSNEIESLILTADEELETDMFISDKMSTNEDKVEVNVNQSKSKRPGLLWALNIIDSIKAVELKQYISKVGPVSTVKIVSNGKDCYGYILMENHQDVGKCLQTLNDTYFKGRKITLSTTKPMPKSNTENQFKRFKIRRRDSSDPLTIKFDDDSRRRRSRSKTHTRQGRERFQSRILEDDWRGKDEMIREMRRKEKQRELEFSLDRERRKLQFERKLFERQRRELFRLDAERRKIARERLEVLKERSQLEQQLQKRRIKVKSSILNPIQLTDYSTYRSLKHFEPIVNSRRKVQKKVGNKDINMYVPPEVNTMRKLDCHQKQKRIEVMIRKNGSDNLPAKKPFIVHPIGNSITELIGRQLPLRNQWISNSCLNSWSGNMANGQETIFPFYPSDPDRAHPYYPTISSACPRYENY